MIYIIEEESKHAALRSKNKIRGDVKVVLFFFQQKLMTIDDNVICSWGQIALLYDFDKSILCRTEY